MITDFLHHISHDVVESGDGLPEEDRGIGAADVIDKKCLRIKLQIS